MPRIPVPLLQKDGDVILDLAAAFATTYDRGRYGRRLRYAEPPAVSLADASSVWTVETASQAIAPNG